MPSRENEDGSVTYWRDDSPEPPPFTPGTAKVASQAESKVVEAPEPEKPKTSAKAESKRSK